MKICAEPFLQIFGCFFKHFESRSWREPSKNLFNSIFILLCFNSFFQTAKHRNFTKFTLGLP